MLVNSLVISQLDYCNAVYYGLPSYLILRLQRVQNTAARLISCSHKYHHITPVLIELHWLPIEYRLKFKILLHVFKVINNLSPTYLTDLNTHQPVPSRSLRSTDLNTRLCIDLNICQSMILRHFFSNLVPVWNLLPESIASSSLSAFAFKEIRLVICSLVF